MKFDSTHYGVTGRLRIEHHIQKETKMTEQNFEDHVLANLEKAENNIG